MQYLYSSTQPSDHNYAHLLYLIVSHPAFKAKVNSFLPLFPYKINADSVIKMGSLIYAALLPGFPKNIHRRMAIKLFHILEINEEQVTYTHLSEYLLKICSDLVENIDVRSAIGILDILESRIVDYYVIDAKNEKERHKLQTSIKLEVFDPETILTDCQISQKFHRKAGQYTYYEQKVVFEDPKNLSPTQIKIKKMKEKPEEVIPIGYVFEEFCLDFINNNFETKHSYRLKGNKNISVPDKIDFWVTINSNAGNTIRDNIVNQQIYKTLPVISATHLPETITPAPHKLVKMYRLNSAFCIQNYYQKLKQINNNPNQQAKTKYFNILSEYFQRNQFNIDEIALTKEKLIVRRKEHLLGITGKDPIKKQVKDYEVQMKILPQSINKFKVQYLNEQRMEQNIKDLSKSLRMVLEQGKNLNTILEKNLSACEDLPKDSEDPFKEDIIKFSNIPPLQILIIGRAKSGKSTLAKEIAKTYNLSYISLESVLNTVIERAKNFAENPPEPDEDGNIKDGLLKIQQCILNDLQSGKCIEDQDMLDLINIQMKKLQTIFRGFILDLPIQYNLFWYKAIVQNRIVLPKIQCRFFNRIIQIDQTEEEWAQFLKGQMLQPQTLTVSSRLERYLQKKPKPPVEEGQEQQEPPNDEEKPPPLVQSNLIRVKWDNLAAPLIEHLSLHINPIHYLKVKNSFQSLQQCMDGLKYQLYKIPHAKKIQGAEKQLLTVGLQEQKIVRKWSPWGLVDCVELSKGKLMMGKFENAAEYAGRVFIFENEQNLAHFLVYPNRFLKVLPSLPKTTNICIAGPRKSGKKTLAKLLRDIYGLKIIDFEQIIGRVIKKQQNDENHIPSNPDRTSKTVHLSEPEYKEFYKGGAINAQNVLPIILFELGITLQKKPVGWGIQKNDEEGGEQPVEEKKPPPKKAKKKDKAEQQRPKTPPLQDLNLKDIIPQVNFKKKLDEIRGFILIGFPNNQDQLNALKAFNIPIDKLILLSDNSEQNPFKTISQRLTEFQIQQIANYLTNFAPVKEAVGQENCKEITNLSLTPEEILNKVRQFVDPFYPKVDDDAVNRVCADKPEEGDPIPMGFCGDYCPVTLSEGWLVKGKQEFQAGFEGRRFKFIGQNQLNLFKENPIKYLCKQNLQIAPRIMFMGLRGVGLKTQLLKINQSYRVPIINFKDTLIQLLQNQKAKRKTERYYNKGFKIPQFDEQGKLVEDPELNDDGADFDKGAVEVECIKKMFNGINEIFINGNYYDVEEETVATPLVDLLVQARRLPQVVFMLKCSEQKWLLRNLDRKKIQEELEEIKEKRRLQKLQERQEARKKAEENGQQYQEPEEEEQDPQIPKLQDLIAQKEETLKGQREADAAKLQQLVQSFKGLNVEVIQVNCDRQMKHVFDRINHSLKPYMTDRMNKWEQNNMLAIERHRVPDFINNYIASNSIFGESNPFTLIKQKRPWPLIYKDRIFYLKDEEERQMVMRNPNLLKEQPGTPEDIQVVPNVAIIGQTKTGKSTLAANLNQKLGLIHITIEQLVQQFTKEHYDDQVEAILKFLKEGNTLTDQQLITLVQKRVTLSDCQQNGWIFDGFPCNRNQCDLLNKKNLLPSNVFSLKLTQLQIKKRVLTTKNAQAMSYDFDMEVIHERLQSNIQDLLEVEVYFITKFNNLDMLDGKISKWGLFEQAHKKIEKKIKGRKSLIRALITRSANPASDIGLDFNCILHHLSDFGNYNPISYKIRREYIRLSPRHHKNLVLYNKNIYFLSNEAQMNDFINNPENYKKKGNAFSPPTYIFETDTISVTNKLQNKGYCPVQLTRKKLVKGNPLHIIKYHDKYYEVSSSANMKLFMKNPTMFEMAKIPDKLPVSFDKKSDLKKIAKKNDCTAFLEHHLSNILMKCLAQLGYRRPKYPTLGSKQTALKFLSISLKAINPNKDEEYRQKYTQKLNQFIKQCTYSQEIRFQLDRKQQGSWQTYDEENLLKLCEQYNEFLQILNSSDKNKYFSQFIR